MRRINADRSYSSWSSWLNPYKRVNSTPLNAAGVQLNKQPVVIPFICGKVVVHEPLETIASRNQFVLNLHLIGVAASFR